MGCRWPLTRREPLWRRPDALCRTTSSSRSALLEQRAPHVDHPTSEVAGNRPLDRGASSKWAKTVRWRESEAAGEARMSMGHSTYFLVCTHEVFCVSNSVRSHSK